MTPLRCEEIAKDVVLSGHLYDAKKASFREAMSH